ncbi:LuxR C-terminal-related transcriptional regulator [Alkalitalea saponilacus]|uniref:DNA-binding transcriptional regulator, CsgD family n=1 Tax=Alkalitalea saponilacus TaxID=889453 RepID=A0A1T5AY74_9BACT|nr:triple tyrosine motif-containing protein [Alkalitalea saponilacus]SKB39935.1 DNA-binding transcriptional regulator, CsgD family [Alkalitalea saponilacus]
MGKDSMAKILLIFYFISIGGEDMFSSMRIPLVRSFEKSDYHAGRQNWDVAVDKDGIIYFANTDGLLSNIYGEWNLLKLEKGGSVRSLHVGNDTIWVGGHDEYGYFFKSDDGILEYNKLGDLDNEIIWNVIEHEEQIIFQSYLNVIVYDKANKQISYKMLGNYFWAIIEWRDELWAITMQGVIGVIRDDRFYHRETFTQQILSEVRDVFIHNDQLFIVSLDDVFVYDKNTLTQFDFGGNLDDLQFFTGTSLDNSTFLLGTVTDGLLIIDYSTGNISSIGKADGLLDNTVLSIETNDGNTVWLGLDYGIAKIDLKRTIHPIFADGATYHIKATGNNFYLSTNKGAFISENNQPFQFINGSAGQVWRIREINNIIYICHNKGLYKINHNKLVPLFEDTGVMDIVRFGQSDYYLLSAYTGVLLAKYLHGKFHVVANLNIWGNPKLHYDSQLDCIWGDTKQKPMVQFVLNNDRVEIKHYDEIERFFESQVGLVFYNGTNLMAYESEFDAFVVMRQPPFSYVAESGISVLDISMNKGVVAYVANDEIKLFSILPDGTVHSYDKFISSVNDDLIRSDPYLFLNNNELLIATDRGVVIFNLEYQSLSIQEKPVITSVNIGSNGIYQKLFFPFRDSVINLPKGRYDLQFQFASPYSDYEFTEYRYKLESYDKEWTEWDNISNRKEYTRIGGGEYRFLLESRVNQSVINQTELTIIVNRRWFQNLLVVIPIIIVSLFLFGYVAFLIIKVIKEKVHLNKLAYEKHLKDEAVKSKNEQLIQFLEVISHKNSFLQDIKGILTRMRNSEATRWVTKIDDELNSEKKLFLYSQLLSENNQEFVVRISKNYPALTDNDIRIISLIRTNMSSKEIAAILNISSSSFDTSRYRIRKKLGLNRDDDLNSFIRNL